MFGNTTVLPSAGQSEFGAVLFRPDGEKPMELQLGFVPLEMICYISYGLRANSDDRYWKGEFVADDCISPTKDKWHPKRFVEGKDIVRWWIKRIRYLEYGTARAPSKFARPTFLELHEAKEKILTMVVVGSEVKALYDDRQTFCNHSCVIFVPWYYLKGIINRSIAKTTKYRRQGGDREEREKLSQQFSLKYVLAIMNSTFAKEWLAKRRRSKISVYPDDWKQLPILPLSLEEQAEFVNLVDAILTEFEQWGYPLPSMAARRVADLEAELDERVAELYADATLSVDNGSD